MDDAISYARASQDRTGEELSVDRQHEDHEGLAAARQWRIVARITDNDVSAAGKRKRPGFERALRMVAAGEANMIVATDMSRLTRGKARDEVRLLELGVETGLTLSFVRAPDLDLSTAAGRLTASILIAAARHEIEVKSERQRRANLQAAQQGRRVGGRRSFGYGLQVGYDEKARKPVLDYDRLVPEEANALADAYDDLLHGVSLGRIAREWNDQDLFTPQAPWEHGCEQPCPPSVRPRSCPERLLSDVPSEWTAQTVRNTLLNPRYAGLRHHVDERLRKSMRPVKARIAGIVGPATWPAVVSEPTWRAAVALLTDPDRANPGRVDRRLLTGVALCGTCGASVHGGASAQKHPTYRCSAQWGHMGRRSEPVDEFVEAVVVEFFCRPDVGSLLAEEEPPDVAALNAEMKELRGRLDEQAALHAAGDIDTAQLRAGSALLQRRMREVESGLAVAGRASIADPLLSSPDPRATWQQMNVDRRRAVIDHFFTVRLLPPGRGVRTFRPETVSVSRRSTGPAPR